MISPSAIAVLLSLAFLWAGALNLYGPSFVVAEFGRWGYPQLLRRGVGIAEWLAALCLLMAETRWAGALLGLAVLAGVIVSLSRTREWMRIEYPLVLTVLCVVVAIASWPGSVLS